MQTVSLNSEFHNGAWVSIPIDVAAAGSVSIAVIREAGANAVLSGVFLGEAGAPPSQAVSSTPQGAWVGAVGSAGYDLAGWNGTAGDVSYMPNATVSLVHGTRYQWATNTTETRALSEPDQLTRSAGAYYDPNQVQVKLNFSAAYSGNLHLYAIDWDSTARRETITVNGQTAELSSSFHEGAWVSFPIDVAAPGGTLTITVDRTAGTNAVLSGIFLGESGAPPALPVSSSPHGNWVGSFGSAGYALAAWNGTSDLTSLMNASLTLQQGSRFQWASPTTDERALESPTGTTRVAGTYYAPTEIVLQLNFTGTYSGNIELYALDWDSTARREIISVNGESAVLSGEFDQGAWMSFPISVAAGETVSITVDRIAGANAVLSGIFLS